MSKTTVHQGQSVFDKAIELTGSVENAFELALANGLSITDSLEIGHELTALQPTRKRIAELFNEKNRPASEIIYAFQDDASGIGAMILSTNFIVK